MNVGKITQVLGAVVDVEFSDSALPPFTTRFRSPIQQ